MCERLTDAAATYS